MIKDPAAIWLAKLERGLRAADGPQLRAWLKDALNRKAIAEQCELSHGPEVMAVLAALFSVDRYLNPKRRSRAPLILSSVVVAIAIVTVGTIGFMEHSPWRLAHTTPFANRVYSTEIDQKIKVPLPDGTDVDLNAGTRIVVEYGARLREVYLVQGRTAVHGEVGFRVPKAQRRPFHVIAGARVLEAADARFNVRQITPQNVEVTVLEGYVRVLSAALGTLEAQSSVGHTSLPGEATIRPFETAIVGPGIESVQVLDGKELAARVAWQRLLK